MLFKSKFLELIKANKVTTAFRKWTKPTVKEAGTLITAVGQLRILSLEKITYDDITDQEIAKAGYDNREELNNELSFKSDGQLYKISFKLEQEDPRIKLREETNLSEEERNKLVKKLHSFDTQGKIQNWTLRILEIIDEKPLKPSIYYANKLGYEQMWFKASVRKLKNLGLTISHEVGYELSPRGKTLFDSLKSKS